MENLLIWSGVIFIIAPFFCDHFYPFEQKNKEKE